MTETLTLTPHEWQRYRDTGKVTHLVVMEPQPEFSNGKDYVRVIGASKPGSIVQYVDPPFRPDDVVRVEWEEKPPESQVFGERYVIRKYKTEATVQSCEAQKVAKFGPPELFAIGYLIDDSAMPAKAWAIVLRDFAKWWNAQHPTRPFESAWVWLARLKRKESNEEVS